MVPRGTNHRSYLSIYTALVEGKLTLCDYGFTYGSMTKKLDKSKMKSILFE